MANYTKTTDFEVKDGLPSGDPGKIIKGTEFEVEFDAISASIATKADQAGPTFTGTSTFGSVNVTGSFTSLGIDDNATSTAITIDGTNDVAITNDLTVDTDTLVVNSTSNRVGIGESTPLVNFHVSGAEATLRLEDTNGTNDGSRIQFFTNATAQGTIRSGGTLGNAMAFYANGGANERMRIDSSGNVGIGTASVNAFSSYRTLEINGGADVGGAIRLSADGAEEYALAFNFNGNAYYGGSSQTILGTLTSDTFTNGYILTKSLHIWYDPSDGSTERMRIDSNGRVGIGQTSPNSKVDITHAQSEGTYAHLEINGKNTDEDTQIALIGSGTGVHKIVANKDLFFGTSTNPADTTTAVTDNVSFTSNGNVGISVGNGDGKGITFGSTTEVAAQTLDYYEEGDWTPVLSDADTGGNVASYGIQRGRYTRIGNVVHCSMEFNSIDTTGMTGTSALKLQGLPFVAKGDIINRVPIAYYANVDLDGAGTSNIYNGLVANLVNGQTYGNFTTNDRTGGGIRQILVSDLTSGIATINGVFTYLTNT